MKAASPYKKLPGLGHQIATYTRLYMGPDHLLQISTAAFNERYKRFYFRDIQAILLVRTQNWVWWIAALGGLGALFLFIALLVDDVVATWVLSVSGGLVIAGALASGIRGPSCKCYIRTAVQTERVPSLNRIRRADKVLTILRPLIDAVQGPISASAQATPAVASLEEITLIPPEEPTSTLL